MGGTQPGRNSTLQPKGCLIAYAAVFPGKGGGEGFEFFLLHPYPYLYENDDVGGGSKECLDWVCLKFLSS